MKKFKIFLVILLLICFAFVARGCKTSQKHKCKDCPTFTHIINCNFQNNNLYLYES